MRKTNNIQQISDQKQFLEKIIFEDVAPAPKLKLVQHVEYQFPVKIDDITLISKPAQKKFKHILREESRGRGFEKCWNRSTSLLKNSKTRINFRCAYCKAFLRFTQIEKQVWKLVDYNNKHCHSTKKKVEEMLIEKAFLQKLQDNSCSQKKIEKQILQSYQITPHIMRKVKSKVFRKKQFEMLKKHFDDYQYDFRYQFNQSDILKEGLPDTLVAISKIHKQNYLRFGECLSYDIFYNCIKQLCFNRTNYSIGIFMGFDCDNKMVIFGFSLNAHQSKLDYKKIFGWFFDIMDSAYLTKTIITAQQPNIINALKQFKEQQQEYSYNLILDNWHFIRSFRSSLKHVDKKIINSIIKKLLKTMKEISPKLGLMWKQKFQQEMEQNNLQNYYYNMLNKFDQICFWKFPKQFVGLIRNSIEIDQILKLQTKNQVDIMKIVNKIQEVSETIHNNRVYEKYPFEILYDDEKITQVRQHFQKKVFNAFMFNYKRSEFYQLVNQSQDQQYEIIHLIHNQRFVIANWECTCGIFQKIGIPCEHLIFLHKKLQIQSGFIHLFNERWEPKLKKEQNRGGRRKSRRNKIK